MARCEIIPWVASFYLVIITGMTLLFWTGLIAVLVTEVQEFDVQRVCFVRRSETTFVRLVNIALLACVITGLITAYSLLIAARHLIRANPPDQWPVYVFGVSSGVLFISDLGLVRNLSSVPVVLWMLAYPSYVNYVPELAKHSAVPGLGSYAVKVAVAHCLVMVATYLFIRLGTRECQSTAGPGSWQEFAYNELMALYSVYWTLFGLRIAVGKARHPTLNVLVQHFGPMDTLPVETLVVPCRGKLGVDVEEGGEQEME
eukprot:NODE_420_length_1717_cov_38.250600_g305_i0.p1 GENE.NODE_420_length_1717_cov_38.250600_g305_i0~~NODE_420_length_1717_cov_38.250600_g305_i0.p1  ORF type:complete len:258 (+),score=35.14 NODE_420_length_1717_cov_38.250600_g305_i0:99-872(+)